MRNNNKTCVINVAIGPGWYEKGQDRMVKSLKKVKFEGDIITWTDQWPNRNFPIWPYNCKASALEEVMASGYKRIFWIDCSVWALKPIEPLFDIIDRDGYYFIDNGYNCAQTCSDASLKYFGVTRDQAEKMPEVATTIFGLNLDHEYSLNFANAFITATKAGAAMGSRHHDNQSADKRFLFHRQDQSVASILYAKHGFDKKHAWGDHLEYLPKDVKPHTIMTLQGL